MRNIKINDKKWGSTTIESGPQYIYILQSFVFSRKNYMISSVFCDTFIEIVILHGLAPF